MFVCLFVVVVVVFVVVVVLFFWGVGCYFTSHELSLILSLLPLPRNQSCSVKALHSEGFKATLKVDDRLDHPNGAVEHAGKASVARAGGGVRKPDALVY